MPLRNSVFIAVSLDGFIAKEDGSLDWLDVASATVPEGEDFGYGALATSANALVMGRKTFEKVLSFGTWPYGDKSIVVLSRQGCEIPEQLASTVSSTSESPRDLCHRLSQEGMTHLYIDGGVLIQSFLQAGLVTDLTITVIPVLLGGGIPLFGALENEIWLEHESTESYACGFVVNRYRVKGPMTS